MAAVRPLPTAEVRKVVDWACQLADLAGERHIEWSDSWSYEDLAAATASSTELGYRWLIEFAQRS